MYRSNLPRVTYPVRAGAWIWTHVIWLWASCLTWVKSGLSVGSIRLKPWCFWKLLVLVLLLQILKVGKLAWEFDFQIFRRIESGHMRCLYYSMVTIAWGIYCFPLPRQTLQPLSSCRGLVWSGVLLHWGYPLENVPTDHRSYQSPSFPTIFYTEQIKWGQSQLKHLWRKVVKQKSLVSAMYSAGFDQRSKFTSSDIE